MEYEVESIEGDKFVRGRGGHRVRKYLVRWVGYPEPTSEPATNLTGCADKLEAYNARGNADGIASPASSAPPPTPQQRGSDKASLVACVDDECGDLRPSLRQCHHDGKKDSTVSENNDSDDNIDYYANVYDTDFQPEDVAEDDGSEDEETKESSDSRRREINKPRSKTLIEATVDRTKAVATGKREITRKLKPPPKLLRREVTRPSRKSDSLLHGSEQSDSDAFLKSDGASSGSDYVFSSDDIDESDDASDSGGSNGENIETIVVIDQADSDEDVLDDEPLAELSTAELRKMADDGFVDAYYGPNRALAYEAADLCQESPSLTPEADQAAQSMRPIDVFFFFLPKVLWRNIAKQTNTYEEASRPNRIAKARACFDSRPERQAASKLTRARENIENFSPITPLEILRAMGLLIARSLNPFKEGIERHWGKDVHGAVPAGTWSDLMGRQRSRDIFRFLHFSDNNDPRAKVDRAWKIRPVVDTLQERFSKGLRIGRWVAFDEMVIPSRSSRNAIRVYLKNKPHKYGMKLFAVCCGETKYCARVDVYCGSRQDPKHVDTLAGPTAVLRNIQALWLSANQRHKKVVVTDREYTSVTLVTRLLALGFYNIGTVTPSRLGFLKSLKYAFKTVPKAFANKRGLTRLKRCIKHPDMFACSWLDKKPVYFLASGVSTRRTSIRRKTKSGPFVDVSCPEFIEPYNQFMNGVDTHDQLRLQRYSVQRSVRFAKYYKMLFLGLFDMALVNAYIVHRVHAKANGKKPLSHAKFRLVLHQQLIQLVPVDMHDVPPRDVSGDVELRSPTYAGTVTTHTLTASTDKKPSGGIRFRVCKACVVVHQRDQSSRIATTRWYCKECSSEKGRANLCNVVQREDVGNRLTCFQTWHQLWKNGKERVEGNQIRIRPRNRVSANADEEVFEELVVFTPSASCVRSPAIY